MSVRGRRNGTLNWSPTVAEKAVVPCGATVAAAGVTVTVVGVAWTSTVTVLVAVSPCASRTATVSGYVPARVKVAVLAFAVLLPLAEKLMAAGPPAELHV